MTEEVEAEKVLIDRIELEQLQKKADEADLLEGILVLVDGKAKEERDTHFDSEDATTHARTLRDAAMLFVDAIDDYAHCRDAELMQYRQDDLNVKWRSLKAAYRLLDIAVSGA